MGLLQESWDKCVFEQRLKSCSRETGSRARKGCREGGREGDITAGGVPAVTSEMAYGADDTHRVRKITCFSETVSCRPLGQSGHPRLLNSGVANSGR